MIFQLCAEDHSWWWRCFFVSGGSSFYVFAYSIFYFVTKLGLVHFRLEKLSGFFEVPFSSNQTVFQRMNQKLEITEFIPSLLYFGYTLMIVFSFWLLTGTIGFYASYLFIKTIYSQIKID